MGAVLETLLSFFGITTPILLLLIFLVLCFKN